MWCKASNRKHKRWEGDAVLVARGRSVVLKDMEGKDIGRGEPVTSQEFSDWPALAGRMGFCLTVQNLSCFAK